MNFFNKVVSAPKRTSSPSSSPTTKPSAHRNNNSNDATPSSSPPRPVTLSEVQQHKSKEDCWVIVHNKVYDMSKYLRRHPGGFEILFRHAGADCTSDFEAMYHSKNARILLERFLIGHLVKEGSSMDLLNPSTVPRSGGYPWQQAPKFSSSPSPFLKPTLPFPSSSSYASTSVSLPSTTDSVTIVSTHSPSSPFEVPLKSLEKISPDTTIFKFHVPQGFDSLLNITPGAHVDVKIKSQDEEDGSEVMVSRSYTPIQADKPTRELHLLVKLYEKGVISKHIHNLKIGDKLPLYGPICKFEYKANVYHLVIMIAGGTGITPMLQVCRAILSNPNDKTKIILLFANRTEEDILLHNELSETYEAFPERFVFHNILSRPKESWTGLRGRFSEEVARNHFPPSSTPSLLFLVCGPPGFNENAQKILGDVGYSDTSRIILF